MLEVLDVRFCFVCESFRWLRIKKYKLAEYIFGYSCQAIKEAILASFQQTHFVFNAFLEDNFFLECFKALYFSVLVVYQCYLLQGKNDIYVGLLERAFS